MGYVTDDWLLLCLICKYVCGRQMDYEIERKHVGGEENRNDGMKESCSDLHETGYARNGLVGLIEDIPPGECRSMGTRVFRVLRHEAYHILYAPLSPSQLRTEKTSREVVL